MASPAVIPDHAIFGTKTPLSPECLHTNNCLCGTPGVEADAVLRDMGRVLEYSNSKQAAARGIEREQGSIAVTIKRLLSFACQVGWAAVAELLLPTASAMGATASELVEELENLADGGLSLLHQAVRSRNVDLVSFRHLLASLAEVVHNGASFLVTVL